MRLKGTSKQPGSAVHTGKAREQATYLGREQPFPASANLAGFVVVFVWFFVLGGVFEIQRFSLSVNFDSYI